MSTYIDGWTFKSTEIIYVTVSDVVDNAPPLKVASTTVCTLVYKNVSL